MDSIQIQLEIDIAADPDIVWRAYVNDVGAWWPEDFWTTSNPHEMKFDPTPGGQLIELGPNGAGVLWATVLAVEPGRAIDLVGHLAARYGGPATSLLRLEFTENEAGGTTLMVADSVFGAVDRAMESALRDGWLALFHEGLREHVESSAQRAKAK